MQAEQWAIEKGFTHIMNLDADILIEDENFLWKLLEVDKDIVMPGRGSGTGTVIFSPNAADRNTGWGCCLAKVEVIKNVSLSSGLSSDYLWPDTMWFKKLRLSGYKIWRCYDAIVKHLEEASNVPSASFQPSMEVQKCQIEH